MASCKKFVSSLFNVVVSLGMFSAILCFHLISFVIFISLSTLIVIGLALIFTYFSGHSLDQSLIFLENLIILILLSFMSKYHLIFYYKLIYPGDNYEQHCWSFNKKVAKLIYGVLASYAFVQVITLYYYRRDASHEHGKRDHDHSSHGLGLENGIKSILKALWEDENKYFLASMAILVHLFSVCLYQDFSVLLESVPLCSCRCFVSISYAVALQTFYFILYFCEFYVIQAWIPLSIIKDNLIIYAVLTQLFVMLWVLQATFFELVTEKMCNLMEKNDKPYYWFQNFGRARIFLLKYVLLPLVVYLFYADHDYSMFNIGGIVPSENPNRSLFFTSFFCAVICHSLKSLMLLKNGLARLAFAVCLCYFIIYDTLNCCENYDDDDDDLTEISSETFSEMTEDGGEGKSDSSTSHFDRNNNNRYNSHSRRLQEKRRQRIEQLNSRDIGDHKRNKFRSSHENLKLPRRMRRGTGDTFYEHGDDEQENNNDNDLNSDIPNNSMSVRTSLSSASHVNVNMKGLYDNNNFRVSSTVI